MEENKKLNKKQIIYKLIVSSIIIALVIVGLYFLFKKVGITNMSKEKLQEIIASTGVYGPLVFILVSFLQVTFIPIPSTITIVAGSFLFGPYLSFAYSYIGIILGSMFAFFLGRKLGRKFVYWVVGDKDTVEKYLQKLKGKEIIVLFFMFLFPFFPDDALCAIAGITSISYLGFLIMQLITRFTSILGNILFLSGEFIPYDKPWGISVIVILSILGIVAFIICMKYSEAIQNWFMKVIDKIYSKFKKNK